MQILAGNDGVVEQDVNLAPFVDGAVDHRGDIGFVGHISAHTNGTMARSSRSFLHRIFIARDHQHLGACVGKLLAHDDAGAFAGPGDDGDFAG